MRLVLSSLLILKALNPASAANPPTNYTPQTTPYNGSEAWYCEDVTHVTDKQCRVVDFISSISTLANLTSAPLLTTTGTVTTGGAAGAGYSLNLGTVTYVGTLRNAAFSAAYTIPFPITSGGTGTGSPALVPGNGITITGSWPNNTITLKVGATANLSPTNPTGTVSTSLVMLGLGSTLKITPVNTGVILFMITGQVNNSASGGSCNNQLSWGTGAAPANGAAATGTQIGTLMTNAPGNNGSTGIMPVSVIGVVSGLALSTQVWFDLAVNVQAGSNCTWSNITGVAMEQ